MQQKGRISVISQLFYVAAFNEDKKIVLFRVISFQSVALAHIDLTFQWARMYFRKLELVKVGAIVSSYRPPLVLKCLFRKHGRPYSN